jgi:hypothetical protein
MSKEMPFGKGLPPVGSILKADYFGKKYVAKIIKSSKTRKGKELLFKGKRYHSLSSAACEVTRYPVNGWKFWKIEKTYKSSKNYQRSEKR